MERMLEIAETLKDLYKRRAGLAFEAMVLTAEIEGRKVELTPEAGWPGSNEGARKAAAEQTFLIDAALVYLNKTLLDVRADLFPVEAMIAGLESERRALEWLIRERALETHGIGSMRYPEAWE